MKHSRNSFGRVASTFLATAMLASLTAVPAGAAGGEGDTAIGDNGVVVDDENGTGLTKLEFDKVLMFPSDVQVPDIEFTFTLTPAKAGTKETITDPDTTGVNQIEVNDGVGFTDNTSPIGTVTTTFGTDIKTATVDNLPGINIADVSYVESENLSISFTNGQSGALTSKFNDAGVYKYVLTEAFSSDSPADSADYDMSSDHIVYLYVSRVDGVDGQTDTYKITGIAMVKAEQNSVEATTDPGVWVPKYDGGALAKTDGNIYNFYQLTGDPDDPEGDDDDDTEPEVPGETPDPNPDDGDDPKPFNNSAIVSKKVAGAMGSHDQDFAFTVNVFSSVTGKKYTVLYMQKNAEGNWVEDADRNATPTVLTADSENNEIELKHDQAIKIIGISSGEKFTAEGEDYSTVGYTTTIVGGTEDAQNKLKHEVTFKKDLAQGESNDIEFTNTRDAVSPTGIAMGVAPYALLVLAAAAGCFVFLRGKNREED